MISMQNKICTQQINIIQDALMNSLPHTILINSFSHTDVTNNKIRGMMLDNDAYSKIKTMSINIYRTTDFYQTNLLFKIK